MPPIKSPVAARLLVALVLLSSFVPSAVLHAQSAQPASDNTHPAPSAGSLAYARTSTARVDVVPERAGWTYRVGEPVKFRVTASADKQALGGLEVRYRVGPEMLPAEERVARLPANGEPLVIDGGTLDEPGFIRCEVTVVVDGRSYREVGTAGLSPGEIRPTQVNPEDFDAFWAAGLVELAKIPLEPILTLLPERCTSKVDVYHLSVRSVGGQNVARIYGILCVPKGEGPFPAVLQVPGAGIRPYSGAVELAERDVITLQIGINGIPVNLPKEVYDQLSAGALNWRSGGYPVIQLDSRENYYYRRVYLGCVRANDFLVSHPKFDGKNLLVMGGSQGGQLSIVTAALDPRVKALSAYYPAYCDVTGYLHGRAGGWPHMMRANEDGSPSLHATGSKLRTTSYYDVVNFARRLKVPGHYAWGYNDTVCPPTSMYAAYNVITAPKKLLLALETGHILPIPEQLAIEAEWIAEQLGLAQ